MTDFARAPVTAVLGPTNTGKTHLATAITATSFTSALSSFLMLG